MEFCLIFSGKMIRFILFKLILIKGILIKLIEAYDVRNGEIRFWQKGPQQQVLRDGGVLWKSSQAKSSCFYGKGIWGYVQIFYLKGRNHRRTWLFSDRDRWMVGNGAFRGFCLLQIWKKDFEDNLQDECVVASMSEYIITCNVRDFTQKWFYFRLVSKLKNKLQKISSYFTKKK